MKIVSLATKTKRQTSEAGQFSLDYPILSPHLLAA
jgi:hypothetical protein